MLTTFPQFCPLTLSSKKDYERLIADYPPFSDISFATLHIWWNLEGKLELSTLNSNLIINYHLPFDDESSGYCLVGKTQLTDSIQIIFSHLRQKNLPIKLVHVPEFVVNEISPSNDLTIQEETDYNEYILDSQAWVKLEGALHRRNRQYINRFLREVEGRKVEIKEPDLLLPNVRKEVFGAVLAWEKIQPLANDPDHTEHAAIKKTLDHASELGIRYLGLYIDSKLHAILLYHQPHNPNYYILHHLKVDYSIPYIFDYMTHRIADKAVEEGVEFLNMEMDLGIEKLRQHKTGLRPVAFFKKYTVTPNSDR